jgi:hypothetical protein
MTTTVTLWRRCELKEVLLIHQGDVGEAGVQRSGMAVNRGRDDAEASLVLGQGASQGVVEGGGDHPLPTDGAGVGAGVGATAAAVKGVPGGVARSERKPKRKSRKNARVIANDEADALWS